MNVFNTNSIFVIVIFILSIGKLNAPLSDMDRKRINVRKCIKNINEIFQGNDLLEHAKFAFNYFQLEEILGFRHTVTNEELRNFAFFSLRKTYDCEDIYGYYLSFEQHLQADQIPDIKGFCKQYTGIIENIGKCVSILKDCFGHEELRDYDTNTSIIEDLEDGPSVPDDSSNEELEAGPSETGDTNSSDNQDAVLLAEKLKILKRLFYKFHSEKIPTVLLNRVDRNEFINIPMSYFIALHDTLGLNTGEGGMLPPDLFCADRYNLLLP